MCVLLRLSCQWLYLITLVGVLTSFPNAVNQHSVILHDLFCYVFPAHNYHHLFFNSDSSVPLARAKQRVRV